MSVLLQFTMFPTDQGVSASKWVSRVIAEVRESGYDYQLNAMSTIVETPTLEEAQLLIAKSYALLEEDCERVYCTIALDIRKGPMGRLSGKVKSIEDLIGPVNH